MEEKEILLKTIEALNTTVSSLSATNTSLQKRIDELTAQVAWLNRQLFGRKSEKLSPFDPNQLDLFSGQVPEKPLKSRKRMTLPLGLSRKRERRNRKMMEDLPYWNGWSSNRKASA